MEIPHLQSLIKRNSNRIAFLEKCVRGIIKSDGYKIFPQYWVMVTKQKKEIAALAALQRVLKDEIAEQILTEHNWNVHLKLLESMSESVSRRYGDL